MAASPPGARPVRIRHVDSLRGVAAGLVIWEHLDQVVAPLLRRPDPWVLGFLHAVPDTLSLGSLGVTIFFAISGFVICRSFGGPREGGARRFLIRRFCRLYPAYWVSMLGGLLVFGLTGQPVTAHLLAANATMEPSRLHQPRLLGVYWTLDIELIFYALCLGLYLARGLERRALLLAMVAVLAFLPRLLRGVDRAAGTHLKLLPINVVLVIGLAVMFWGVLFRLAYDETGGFRRGVWRCRGTWLVIVGLLVLVDAPEPQLKWFLLGLRPGPAPPHLTVVYALVVFTLWIACLRIDHPVLTYLGVISYSLYLFHAVPQSVAAVLVGPGGAASGWNLPLWPWALACAGATVVLAAAVFRWVERPAIALGKRWAGSIRPPAAARANAKCIFGFPSARGLTSSEAARAPMTYPILDPSSASGGHPQPGVIPGACALAMMIKAPRPGASKTRLSPPLTPEEAAALSGCFLRDTTANIAAVAAAGVTHTDGEPAGAVLPAAGVAVYTPTGTERAFDGLLPAGFCMVAQREGGFGERLIGAVDDLFACGYGAVCLIDSDSPTLPAAALAAAVRALSLPGDRAVLGPSEDGGYYLIGLKKPHRRLFEDITWSTEHVARETLARAAETGLEMVELPPWYDVDDAATLRALCDELFAGARGEGFHAPQTRAFLAGVIEREGRARIWPEAAR